MTKAEQLRSLILESNFSAFTLEGGYGVTNNKRTIFSEVIGEHLTNTKRANNNKGRCVRFSGEYSDGSKIVYTYNSRHEQYKLVAK